MRIELASMGWLPYVRRRMRKSGLRLTVRWGRVYTVAAVEARQPDSEAQLRARDVLARASEAAREELRDAERRLYWDTHAAEMGYKMARGACVAHHVRRLKEEMSETRTEERREVSRAVTEGMSNEERRREREANEEAEAAHNEVTDRALTKEALPKREAEKKEREARPTEEEVMRMVTIMMYGSAVGRRRKRQESHAPVRKRRHCVEA